MFIPLKDFNPTRTFPIITILIIALNAGVFIYQNFLAGQPPEYFVYSSAVVPWEITHLKNTDLPVENRLGRVIGYFPRHISPALSIFYSLFMHGGLLHIFLNMLFLWIFGNNVEDKLGKIRFILFYFLSGVGSSLIHVAFNPNSMVPVIGASGAISGVMGAYLLLFPRARIRTLIFLFILVTFADVPAALFLLLWFFLQFLNASGGTGIAWLAHVGGFVLGLVFCRIFAKRRRPRVEVITDDDSGDRY